MHCAWRLDAGMLASKKGIPPGDRQQIAGCLIALRGHSTCSAFLLLRPFCPLAPCLSWQGAASMFSEAVTCSQLPQANTSEKASNHSAMLTLVFICNSTNQTLTAAPAPCRHHPGWMAFWLFVPGSAWIRSAATRLRNPGSGMAFWLFVHLTSFLQIDA